MVYVLFLKCIKKQTLQCHILRNDVAIYSMDYRRVKTETALAERLIILPALSNYCILFVAIIVVLIKSKAFHMLWPEFCFSSWEHVLVMPHKNVFKLCVRTVIIIWTVNSDVCRSLSWSPPTEMKSLPTPVHRGWVELYPWGLLSSNEAAEGLRC